MKLIFKKALVLAIVLAGNGLWAQAQLIEDVLKVFPDDHAVFLGQKRNLKLYYKDNAPVAESNEKVDILVLSEKANGIYNKYRVFHGSFDELKDLENKVKNKIQETGLQVKIL